MSTILMVIVILTTLTEDRQYTNVQYGVTGTIGIEKMAVIVLFHPRIAISLVYKGM